MSIKKHSFSINDELCSSSPNSLGLLMAKAKLSPSDYNFDFHDMPQAYLCDNVKANTLREQLIKNHVKIAECAQGDLETIFFSNENINIINKQLILIVYKISDKKFKIPEQSKDDLIIIMRYVFIEYARHLPYNISNQIIELNNKVVNEILPNILTNINQKLNYLN